MVAAAAAMDPIVQKRESDARSSLDLAALQRKMRAALCPSDRLRLQPMFQQVCTCARRTSTRSQSFAQCTGVSSKGSQQGHRHFPDKRCNHTSTIAVSLLISRAASA